MNVVKIKNLTIGEGRPKICIPVMGRDDEEIIFQVSKCNRRDIDLIEIRIDYYKYIQDDNRILNILSQIRKIYNKPIIYTFRSFKEGGFCEIDDERYFHINKLAMESGHIDIIDVELFMPEIIIKELIKIAHKNNTKVLMSNHDFDKTIDRDMIISRLCKMQDMNADITKIALMPQNEKDVLDLLYASLEMKNKYADRPFITISMGSLGKISRVVGEIFGSAITFGTIDKSSAPGQINMVDLNNILEILSS